MARAKLQAIDVAPRPALPERDEAFRCGVSALRHWIETSYEKSPAFRAKVDEILARGAAEKPRKAA